MRGIWLAFLLCVAAAAPAAADDTYVDIERRLTAEQRQATGLDTLTPEQLALLNQLLREQATQAVQQAKAEARAEVAARSETENTQREPDPSRLIGFAEGPIQSRVTGTVTGWSEGHEFRLENGQVWKVLKGHMQLPEPMESPAVRVVPGVAGRWFLEVHEDYPKARVYRVD